MSALQGKHILLGICGGIAAYKTPHLVRLLRQAGASVQVVMTHSAGRFVTSTSLQAVAGTPVRDTLWDEAAEAHMGHIELARWADVILIAPTTADRLARLASGMADDLLGALTLATRAPVLLAPAMNSVMWEAPATQRNIQRLLDDGIKLIGPDSGSQACGETGPGRMCEPEVLTEAVADAVAGLAATEPGTSSAPAARLSDAQEQDPTRLDGVRVVVTAGPTREALDPVRFISNHSSGRQGYALAEAARDLGADVTLISGPVSLAAPEDIQLIRVTSAVEMLNASLDAARRCDLFVGVAAVADYRPATTADRKIKKRDTNGAPTDGKSHLRLDLTENPDIIASVAALEPGPVVIGFAAETHDALNHARAKLVRKDLDAIVVNDVSDPSIGFHGEDNAATMIWPDGERILGRQSKYRLGRAVLCEASRLFVRQLAPANPANVAK